MSYLILLLKGLYKVPKCLVQCLIHSTYSVRVFFTCPIIVQNCNQGEPLSNSSWAHELDKKVKPLSLWLNFLWTLSISFSWLCKAAEAQRGWLFPPFSLMHTYMHSFICPFIQQHFTECLHAPGIMAGTGDTTLIASWGRCSLGAHRRW